MAADGSLTFDTSLDTSGFEAGSEKLLKAVERLKAQINGFGASMAKSFSTALPTIKSVASAGKSNADAMTAAVKRYDAELEKQRQKIDAQKDAMSDYYKAVKDANELAKELESSGTGTASSAREYEAKLLDEIDKKYAKQISKLTELEDEYYRLADAREKAAQAAQEAADNLEIEDTSELSKAIDKASAAIDKYQAKVDKMNALGATDRQWASIEYDINKASEQLDKYRAKLDELNSSGQIKPGEYEALSGSLNAASEAMARLTSSIPPVSEESEEAEQSLRKVDSELKQKPQDASAASKALSGFGDAVKSVGAKALAMSGTLAKMPIRAFGSSITGFTKKLSTSISPTDKLVKSLTSLKRLMLTRIKRMFISAIFNQAKESLKALAQFSSGFNASMSNIQNSAKRLSGNLAVSIGGVIKTLEPMITRFINALNSAIVSINKFFATLGGKSSITVAKKQTDDYAASLAGVGKSAKQAGKQLAGFDEIEKLQAQDAGGGADVDEGNLFEEMELGENVFNSWGEAFDNMLDTILTDGIPRLREGLLNFVDWLNGITGGIYEAFTFPGIVEKVQQVGQSLANAFNDLTNAIQWEQLGQALGAGLNLALQFLVNFVYTYDWINLGNSLAQSINGMVSEIDWNSFGQFLWAKFKIALETLAGFLLGLNIPELGKAAANIINGFFSAMGETINKIDWKDLAHQIVLGLNSFIQNIDWANAGKTFSDGFHGVLEFLKTAAREFDWAGLGRDIGDFIVNVDWGQLFLDLLEIGGYVIGGLLEGILSIFGKIDQWIKENIVDPFVKWIKKLFGIHSPSTVMSEIGTYLIEGLLEGISGIWHKITDFFDKSVENLKKFFSDAWENIKKTATTTWNNIKENITDIWNNLKETASTVWNNVKDFLSTTWENIKTTATEAWNTLKTNVTETFDKLKEKLLEIGSEIKEKISEKWDDIKETASEKWEGIKTKVTELWNGLKDFLRLDDWEDVGKNLVDGIKSGITNAWHRLTEKVSDLADGLTRTVRNIFGISSPSKVWAEIGGYLGEGLENGIDDEKRSILSSVSDIAKSMTNTLSKATLDIDGVNVLSQLQAVADRVTFRAPAIASGSVIPAGVAAAVEAPTMGGYGGYQGAYGGTDYSGILNELLQAVRAGKVMMVDNQTFATLVYNAYTSENTRQGPSLVQMKGGGF